MGATSCGCAGLRDEDVHEPKRKLESIALDGAASKSCVPASRVNASLAADNHELCSGSQRLVVTLIVVSIMVGIAVHVKNLMLVQTSGLAILLFGLSAILMIASSNKWLFCKDVGRLGETHDHAGHERRVCAVAMKHFLQVKDAVEADAELFEAVDRHRMGEPLKDLLQRFARARPSSVKQAITLLRDDMSFRDKENIPALTKMSSMEVLGGKASLKAAHDSMMPHGYLGRDLQGRPVIYKHYGRIQLWELVHQGIDVRTLVRYNYWIQEQLAVAMGHRGQWTVILDLEGIEFSQAFSTTHLSYCHALAKTDSAHYPERLGQVFIINSPSLFAGSFKIISSWLDESSRRKVKLMGERNQWWPEVTACIDPKILPKHLGGEALLTLRGVCPLDSGCWCEKHPSECCCEM